MEIEDTTSEGFSFRMVITLRKLGVVTMLDYFISLEEAQDMAEALRKGAGQAESE